MPNRETIDRLLHKYPLISDQVDKKELTVILEQLQRQLALFDHGSVVEFGCYVGTSSLFIRRLLDAYNSNVAFHVYDSFEGLPEKLPQDLSPAGEQFRTGELAASRKLFEQQFKKAGLKPPRIHKSWFSLLSVEAIPEHICFAYLDGDYYQSIHDSLRLIAPRLVEGAVIVVDDYANEALPGVAKAVDEWLRTNSASFRVEASLALISNIRS